MTKYPICLIMIGPAGCGKSTKAKELSKAGYKIISSDQIRKELLGSEEDQSNPARIFQKVENDVIAALRQEENAIIDATNLESEKRNSLIAKIRAAMHPHIHPIFIGISFHNVSLLQCLQQNNKRERVVPERVIAKQFLAMNKDIPINKGFGLDAVISSDETAEDIHTIISQYLQKERDKPYHIAYCSYKDEDRFMRENLQKGGKYSLEDALNAIAEHTVGFFHRSTHYSDITKEDVLSILKKGEGKLNFTDYDFDASSHINYSFDAKTMVFTISNAYTDDIMDKWIYRIDSCSKEELEKEKQRITELDTVTSLPNIKGITLLSLEEYEELKANIPPLDDHWWLRSPGKSSDTACSAYNMGFCDTTFKTYVNLDVLAARPALIVESSELKVGDKFQLGNHNFTMISDKYALCDNSVGHCCFRGDKKAGNANDYEASDVKKFIEDWLEKNLERQKDQKELIEEQEMEP